MGRISLCSDYGGAGFLLENRAFCGFPAGESERKREIRLISRIIKNFPKIFTNPQTKLAQKAKQGNFCVKSPHNQ